MRSKDKGYGKDPELWGFVLAPLALIGLAGTLSIICLHDYIIQKINDRLNK